MDKPKNGFKYIEKDGIEYATISEFEDTKLVRMGFTSRKGGVSSGFSSNLNFNIKRGDSLENVRKNYLLISDVLSMNMDDFVLVNYEHGVNVCRVSEKDKGKGIKIASDLPYCDGLITNNVGVPLVTLHADCLGIFYLDPVKKCIGVCHAGWKGVVLGMGNKMVESMQKEFGTEPSDLMCGITAHIGPCCFEVDKPVVDAFENAFEGKDIVVKQAGKKDSINLDACVRKSLLKAGVKNENIFSQEACSSCESDRFFSHRRDKGKTGSMASIIMLV